MIVHTGAVAPRTRCSIHYALSLRLLQQPPPYRSVARSSAWRSGAPSTAAFYWSRAHSSKCYAVCLMPSGVCRMPYALCLMPGTCRRVEGGVVVVRHTSYKHTRYKHKTCKHARSRGSRHTHTLLPGTMPSVHLVEAEV